jgi:hypothetical protein
MGLSASHSQKVKTDYMAAGLYSSYSRATLLH